MPMGVSRGVREKPRKCFSMDHRGDSETDFYVRKETKENVFFLSPEMHVGITFH